MEQFEGNVREGDNLIARGSDFLCHYILALWLVGFLCGLLNVDNWPVIFHILAQHTMIWWPREEAEESPGRFGRWRNERGRIIIHACTELECLRVSLSGCCCLLLLVYRKLRAFIPLLMWDVESLRYLPAKSGLQACNLSCGDLFNLSYPYRRINRHG